MSNLITNTKTVPVPNIGSRLFNIYLGERKEKEDSCEKLGQVYIFCLHRAIGKRVYAKQAQPCDIKIADVAL